MTAKKTEPKEIVWYGETEKQRVESARVYFTIDNLLRRFGQQMTDTEVNVLGLAMLAQTVREKPDDAAKDAD